MAGSPTISLGGARLKPGERVVYPNQGVCLIVGIETKEIGGAKTEFLTMKREEDGATVMVPRAKVASIGLRHVADRAEVEGVLKFLASDGEDPELDWKIRHRANAEKMVGGSLQGTADVLKGLHSLALLRPLPPRERELYDSARHLLTSEVAVALGVSSCTAEDSLDLALSPVAGSARAEAQAQRLKAVLDHDAGLGDLELEGESSESEGEEEAEAAPPPAAPAPKAKAGKPTKAKASPPAKKAVAKPAKATPKKKAPK